MQTVNYGRVKREAHNLSRRANNDRWNIFRQIAWNNSRPKASTWDVSQLEAQRGRPERDINEPGTPIGHVETAPELGRPRGASPEVNGEPSKEQEIQDQDFAPPERHNSQQYSGETTIYPPQSPVIGSDGGMRNRKPESTKEATEENAQVGDKKKPRKEHRLFKHVEPKEPFTIRNQLQRTFLNSWINVLLLAAPVGIILGAVPGMNKIAIFVVNFIAIIPLAAMLSFATEEIALRKGETLGGLLNATFG